MTKTLAISEARQNLTDLVDRVRRLQSRYVITVNGRPDAVIISHDEFESWLETLDVLSDSEEVASIQRGLSEIANGHTVSYEDVFGETIDGRKIAKR
ncbi:type II toxin-antitoxin system Phd/YefM family antitoxin [Candidatus Nitrospira bockiana]